ncbi:MAG: hypothetical protein Q4B43_03865 [Bacteroidota bacterium]|nr:hypothetical protein [Bacteroidota bacterium]
MRRIFFGLGVILTSSLFVSCDNNEATSVKNSVYYLHPNREDTERAEKNLVGSWKGADGKILLIFDESGSNILFEDGQEIAKFGYVGVSYNQVRITHVTALNQYLIKDRDYTYMPIDNNKLYFDGIILYRM